MKLFLKDKFIAVLPPWERFKPTIISTHIFQTFIWPFFVGLFFFTFTILVFYLKNLITRIIEKGMDISYLLELIAYSSTWTFGFTIPMSTLLAIIIAMGGLNGDSEIIAMRAGGITYPRIFRPFFIFGVFITIFLLWFNQEVIPQSYHEMRVIGRKIWAHDPIAILEEGQFTLLDKTENSMRTIYLEKIVKDKSGEDEIFHIQIRELEKIDGEMKTTRFISAKKGKKMRKVYTGADGKSPPKSMRALRLYQGYVFTYNEKNKSFQRIDFSNGFMDIHIADKLTDDLQLDKEMTSFTFRELNTAIDDLKKKRPLADGDQKTNLHKLRMEFHKRLALPFAALSFLIIGFPVSIVNRRSGKGMGLGISVMIIFLYFIFFLSSDAVSEKGGLHPMLATWLGNFVMVALGAYLYIKRASEGAFTLLLSHIGKKISGFFTRRNEQS